MFLPVDDAIKFLYGKLEVRKMKQYIHKGRNIYVSTSDINSETVIHVGLIDTFEDIAAEHDLGDVQFEVTAIGKFSIELGILEPCYK